MTLTSRKLTVLAVVTATLLLANAYVIVDWLSTHGVVHWARGTRAEFFTSTALTIIVVLIFLLPSRREQVERWICRCRVCHRVCFGSGRYCATCGSQM